MLTERSFDTDTLAINYAEGAPNGAPLLVLHGLSARWEAMSGLIVPLTARWHVFACDERGHGKSGRASSYRAIDYFPDTAAFVQRQIGSSTVLLGHSGGAMTALGAAAQIPELTRAIVLLEPPFCLRELSFRANHMSDFMEGVYGVLTRKRAARDVITTFFPQADEGIVQWFDETLSYVDPELVKVLLEDRYFDGLNLGELLDKVTCPVLMIHGDPNKGSLVRASDVEFFLSHTRNGKAVHLEGTGHYLHAEQPAGIVELVTQWMQELRLLDLEPRPGRPTYTSGTASRDLDLRNRP